METNINQKHVVQSLDLLSICSNYSCESLEGIEIIQCHFLLGNEEGRRKYQLVKCEDVKMSMDHGGLGLRSLIEMSIALQLKWIWRYMREENMLWKIVIDVC